MSNILNPSPHQWSELAQIARDHLRCAENDVKISNWLEWIPPWCIVRTSPLKFSAVFTLLFFALQIAFNASAVDVIYILKFVPIYFTIFVGIYGAFYLHYEYQRIYSDLVAIVKVNRSTFSRWFIEHISFLFGSVNRIPFEERNNYRFIDMLKTSDKWILLQCFFWTVINGSIAFFVLRDVTLPVRLEVGWLFEASVGYLWAFSFVWTSHFVPASINFLSKFKHLPVRYSFHIPDSMTLRTVGARIVRIAWLFSLHLWLVLVTVNMWDVYSPRASEDPVLSAWIILSASTIFFLYLVWQAMAIFFQQVALSKNMATYKRRFIAEFYHSIEKASETYLRDPSRDSYEKIQEFANQKKLFNKLPIFSLSRSSFVSLILLIFLNISFLILFFIFSIGSIESLKDLFDPIIR